MSWKAPERALRTVKLSSGLYQAIGNTTYDNNSNLNAAASDNSSGTISFPMKGGRVSLAPQNPADAAAVGIAFPLQDINGNTVTGDLLGMGMIELDWPDGSPAMTDNVTVGVGISNESAMSGTTRDGLVGMVEFNDSINASNARVKINRFVDGADGTLINGANTAGVVGCRLVFFRSRTGGGTLGGVGPILTFAGLDSSGIAVSGAGANWTTTTGGVTAFGTGQIYGILFLLRNKLANNNVITPKPRVRYAYSSQYA